MILNKGTYVTAKKLHKICMNNIQNDFTNMIFEVTLGRENFQDLITEHRYSRQPVMDPVEQTNSYIIPAPVRIHVRYDPKLAPKEVQFEITYTKTRKMNIQGGF